MVLAYRPIVLAEACYIFEATFWIALGQLPEFAPDGNGNEARLNPHEHDDHFVPVMDPKQYLDAQELAVFLPGLDKKKYEHAMTKTYGRSADQILDEAEEFASRLADSDVEEVRTAVEERLNEADEEAELAEWLEENTMVSQHRIDQARAKVFLELASGKLKSRGYVLRLNEEKNYQYADIVDISPEAWTWDGVAWDLAGVEFGGDEVIGAHIATSAMLELFPTPDIPLISASGKFAGSTFLPSSDTRTDTGTISGRKVKGRPAKGDGLVKTAIKNEYLRRLAAGELVAKKEANIQALIEWASAILGEKVGRSSVQRWLGNVSEIAQNKMPKNGRDSV